MSRTRPCIIHESVPHLLIVYRETFRLTGRGVASSAESPRGGPETDHAGGRKGGRGSRAPNCGTPAPRTAAAPGPDTLHVGPVGAHGVGAASPPLPVSAGP